MIKEVQMYTVICDNCGIDANEGTEYSGWDDASFAEYIALESGWIVIDDKHYCPNCYDYDDEDNLIFRKIKPL